MAKKRPKSPSDSRREKLSSASSPGRRTKTRPRLQGGSLYAQLLLPGEILKQSPDPLEEIVQRHVSWAQEVLRRAGLPTALGLHYHDGTTWIPAGDPAPGLSVPDRKSVV
jgi:hypothetical protein